MKHLKINMIYAIIGITVIVIMFLWFGHIEGFENQPNKCPTNLIKNGNKILLYNPQLAKVPGVNPIQFNSLDDYSTYIEWQRVNKVHCPILKLDKTFDNNTNMYSIQSSSSSSTTSYDIGNGNGTSALNHDLPNTASCTDNGVPRIDNPNYTLDYYTSDLNDLNDLNILPTPPLQLNSVPSSKLSINDSKMKPSSVTEAFSTKLINSTDLTTLSHTLEKF